MPAVRSSLTCRRPAVFAIVCVAIPAVLSKNDAVRTRLILGVISLLALSASPFTQTPARYDILIRNGRVLDGSGNPWLAADIGIRGGRIVDMGRLGNATAARVIDAHGLTVSQVSSTCIRTRQPDSKAR